MKVELSTAERAILINQNRMLSKLDPDNADLYEKRAEILESGYSILYSEAVGSLSDSQPVEIGDETFEILSMFRVINNTLAGITPEQRALLNIPEITFDGFDMNDREGHYHFADFLINQDDRYQELSEMYLNSHSGMSILKYRGLLPIYHEAMRNGGELTFEHLQRMAGIPVAN